MDICTIYVLREILEIITSFLIFPNYARVNKQLYSIAKTKDPDVLSLPLEHYISEKMFDLARYRISLTIPSDYAYTEELVAMKVSIPYSGV